MSYERDRIIFNIVAEMQTVNDDLRLPVSIWEGLADAALRVIERPMSTDQEIKHCTCGHNGYGKHKAGCALC